MNLKFLEKIKENLKNNRKVYILCTFVFFVVFFSSYAVMNLSSKTGIPLYSEKGAQYGILKPLNHAASKGQVKKDHTACFGFSDVQKILIQNINSENSNASLVVRLWFEIPEKKEDMEFPFSYGFLNSSDFKKGKLSFNISDHLLVYGNAGDGETKNINGRNVFTCDISLAFPKDSFTKNGLKTEGFFIKSNARCRILSTCAAPVVCGYDKSTEIPFYGFPSNGGKAVFSSSSFDFTGVTNNFSRSFGTDICPPDFEISFSKDDETSENVLSFGGEKIVFRRLENIVFSSALLKKGFSTVDVSENSRTVTKLILKNGSRENCVPRGEKVLVPIKSDPGLILNWNQNNWRCPDYELFTWDRIPGVLFFDTRNYAVQSSFFRRLAFFVEKEGFKGRLLTDEELEGKHDYNAHDYSTESLARFFNKVYRTDFSLSDEEQLLLKILLKNGLLEFNPEEKDPYKANPGGILSISRQIPSYNRVSLLAHEGWHMLFFIDPDFRNYVAAVYNTMDSNTLNFLTDYFKSQPSLGYDTNDEYLMHNEFMAYILQQPVSRVSEYFLTRAGWGSVMKFTPDLCRYIKETEGRGFEDCAEMLQDYVFEKYNLKAGNIGLCTY